MTGQAEHRLQVPIKVPERTVQKLNHNMQGCFDETIFNLQEVGISDWEDRDAWSEDISESISKSKIHFNQCLRVAC
jgi:hypothetical protein